MKSIREEGVALSSFAKMFGLAPSTAHDYATAKPPVIPSVKLGSKRIVPMWFVEKFREELNHAA